MITLSLVQQSLKGHKIIFLIWLHENSKYFAQISLHFSPSTQAFYFFSHEKIILFKPCHLQWYISGNANPSRKLWYCPSSTHRLKTPKLTHRRPQAGGTQPCSVIPIIFFIAIQNHSSAYKHQCVKLHYLTNNQQPVSQHRNKPKCLQEERNHFNLAWLSQLSDLILPGTKLASTYHCFSKIRTCHQEKLSTSLYLKQHNTFCSKRPKEATQSVSWFKPPQRRMPNCTSASQPHISACPRRWHPQTANNSKTTLFPTFPIHYWGWSGPASILAWCCWKTRLGKPLMYSSLKQFYIFLVSAPHTLSSCKLSALFSLTTHLSKNVPSYTAVIRGQITQI